MELLASLFYFIIIIPSAILHEYMHGWVADRLGDPTARYAGRLTLNPVAHVDLWGTILMPLMLYFATGGRFVFAYAKPVPYNPYNLRDQKIGPLLVAIAGPLANFALAAAFGFLIRILPVSPLAPFLSLIVLANIMLGVFNLVPIPPLDGSKILYAVLPSSLDQVKAVLERYGFVILIFFIFFFFPLLQPIVDLLYRFFAGGY